MINLDTTTDAREVRLEDGRPALIRDLRPEDGALYPRFAEAVTPEDVRLRFFAPLSTLTEQRIAALTHYDPAEARAFIALDPDDGAMLGVGRVHRDGPKSGEFAVIVRSDLKGRGLGHSLMDEVIRGAAALGLHTVWGLILRENAGMIALARDLGFSIENLPSDPGLVLARRPVHAAVPIPLG